MTNRLELVRKRIVFLKDALSVAKQKDGAELLALRTRMRREVSFAFEVQRFAIMSAILSGELLKRKRVSAVETKAAHPLDTVLDGLDDAITSGQEAAYTLGIVRGASNVGVSATFQVRNTEAEAYARDFGSSRIVGINNVTKERVNTIIARGMANGLGPREIAQWLAEDGVFSPERAFVIAQTETATAYGAGNYAKTRDLSRDLGVKVEKQWITSGDERVCSICLTGEGDGWIPLDARFSNGLDHEPSHPRCRCTIEYRTV